MSSLSKRTGDSEIANPCAEVIETHLQGNYSPFEDSISLQHYYRILLRRKWLILAAVVTSIVIATVQVFTATPMYRATATMQIDPEESKVLPYEQIAESGGSWSGSGTQEYLLTQVENLRSRALMKRVGDRLKLEVDSTLERTPSSGLFHNRLTGLLGLLPGRREGAGPNRRDEAPAAAASADLLLGGVEAQAVRNTRLVQVSYTSHDPDFARRVANAVVEEFIEQHLENKYEATIRASDFLQNQLLDLKTRVEMSEEELVAYARSNNIVNIGEREAINLQRFADLNKEMTDLEDDLIRQRSLYEIVSDSTVNSFPDQLKDEAILGLERRLSSLEQERARLSSRFGSAWPQVKEVGREIQELGKQIRIERRRALERASLDYRVSLNRRARLATALNEQKAIVDQLNEDSIQYNILKREVETNKGLYLGLLQRLKEAGVAAGLKSSNIRLADEATLPRFASWPNKRRALGLALAIGLFLGVGAGFLLEALDNTIKTTDDVTQQLGLPTLGVIPTVDLVGNGERPKKARRQRQIVQGLQTHRSSDWLQNRASEAYRSLRTSILLSHSGQPPQALMIASALPGEGKTTTVANMGVVLAQTGARTLLLDLDMRKSALAGMFNLSNREGMSTYLTGNSDISSPIQESRFPNLFLAPAGPSPPNPAELVGSSRMRSGLRLLRNYFTYIVIDTPPVLEISDALALSSQVDGVVVVVQAGKSPKEAVRKGSEQVLRVGGRILGVLLNDVDARTHHYGYYGYYGKSYRSYYSSSSANR